MKYIANAFSLAMISEVPAVIRIDEISLEEAKRLLSAGDFVSAVGHEATADVVSRLTGVDIKFNRINIKLDKGDQLIVFQLLGRLPEGKILSEEEIKSLPYKFFLVTVE